MRMPYVDLHVHSFYSDGSMSPEELAASAAENRVGVLALADHDTVEGIESIRRACESHGIRHIPAVEIDTTDNSINYHILAYGFDMLNVAFLEYIAHTRFLLDESSVRLVEVMSSDYHDISIEDYMDFCYDRRLGGWKALHYFIAKGLTTTLKEGIMLYPRYGMTYDKTGYSSVAAAAYRIRAARGLSVLAHPGELIEGTDIEVFKTELRRLARCGLDGVECYYPTHTAAVTQACLEVCREYGLMITAGSDCHGAFGKARVGETETHLENLSLRPMLDRL